MKGRLAGLASCQPPGSGHQGLTIRSPGHRSDGRAAGKERRKSGLLSSLFCSSQCQGEGY